MLSLSLSQYRKQWLWMPPEGRNYISIAEAPRTKAFPRPEPKPSIIRAQVQGGRHKTGHNNLTILSEGR